MSRDPGDRRDGPDRGDDAVQAAVRAELAALPVPPLPPGAVERWCAVLDALPPAPDAGPPAPGERVPGTVVPLTPGPSPVAGSEPRADDGARRWWLVAAAAAVVLVVTTGIAGLGSRFSWPDDVVAVTAIDLPQVGAGSLGAFDLGRLSDPDRRAGCLAAVGIDPGADVLGGRRVRFDGRDGLLLVMSTGELGRFSVVVVDPACGPAGGRLLATDTIG